MTIDTVKEVMANRKVYYIIPIVTITIIMFFVLQLNANSILFKIKHYVIIATAAAFLLYAIHSGLKKLSYFYFNDDSEKIIIRHFSLYSFKKKHIAYEINKTSFAGYELRKKFAGIRKELIVSQRTKKGVFTYPPVSIGILKLEDEKRLISQLEKYIKK